MTLEERGLSTDYGVSIGSVKRSVELFRDDGLVHTVSGRGIFVTRRDKP
jgi:DNA-binding GntR family transcriptional regulator